MQCLVSISDGLAGYTFPLYNTLAVQKALAHSIEPVRALGLLTLLHDPKPSGSSQSELATNCARENVDEEAMISRDSDEGDLEDDEGGWIYWKLGDLRDEDLIASAAVGFSILSSVLSYKSL